MTIQRQDEVRRTIMQGIQVLSAIGVFSMLFQLGSYKEKIDNVILQVREIKCIMDVNAADNTREHLELRMADSKLSGEYRTK